MLRKVAPVLTATLLLFAAASAADQPPPDKCPPRGGMMGMFSPEQRLMMMADAQKATADGSLSMQDYRSMQRDKIRAMSEEQRQAYFADLTKRFKALPAAEQNKLKADAEQRRKDHPMMGGGDRPNCPPPKG